jgi:hypothetical protein
MQNVDYWKQIRGSRSQKVLNQITTLSGAASGRTHTQQASMAVIGFLHAGLADGYASKAAAFRRGLREAGYTEGDNVAIKDL